MTKKIHYITQDNGDGSSSVLFFENGDLAQAVVDNDDNHESFWGNEGCVSSFEVYHSDGDDGRVIIEGLDFSDGDFNADGTRNW